MGYTGLSRDEAIAEIPVDTINEIRDMLLVMAAGLTVENIVDLADVLVNNHAYPDFDEALDCAHQIITRSVKERCEEIKISTEFGDALF